MRRFLRVMIVASVLLGLGRAGLDALQPPTREEIAHREFGRYVQEYGERAAREPGAAGDVAVRTAYRREGAGLTVSPLDLDLTGCLRLTRSAAELTVRAVPCPPGTAFPPGTGTPDATYVVQDAGPYTFPVERRYPPCLSGGDSSECVGG